MARRYLLNARFYDNAAHVINSYSSTPSYTVSSELESRLVSGAFGKKALSLDNPTTGSGFMNQLKITDNGGVNTDFGNVYNVHYLTISFWHKQTQTPNTSANNINTCPAMVRLNMQDGDYGIEGSAVSITNQYYNSSIGRYVPAIAVGWLDTNSSFLSPNIHACSNAAYATPIDNKFHHL